MTRFICCLILVSMCFIQAGCNETEKEIEFISISFPQGGTDLRVWKDGRASLFYGALPQNETIKNGTFNIKQLYDQIRPRLHPNLPREEWPDPKAKCGMVLVKIKGKEEESYLIYDEQEFTDALFDRARSNIVGKSP